METRLKLIWALKILCKDWRSMELVCPLRAGSIAGVTEPSCFRRYRNFTAVNYNVVSSAFRWP